MYRRLGSVLDSLVPDDADHILRMVFAPSLVKNLPQCISRPRLLMEERYSEGVFLVIVLYTAGKVIWLPSALDVQCTVPSSQRQQATDQENQTQQHSGKEEAK